MEAMEEHTIDKITQRNLERKLGLQKRKEDKDNLTADNEKLDYFEKYFLSRCSLVNDLLLKSYQVDKIDLPNHFNEISKEILLLQKYVAASNIFLRSYDIKKCQKTLQDLTNKARDLEEELIPKKRFGFKNKNKFKSNEKIVESKDVVDFSSKILIAPKQMCGFSNKSNKKLIMKGDEIYKRDIAAENMNNCKIMFLGSPSTLHLNGLKNCYVFTGPVSTSIFADNCINCTLVIACQQLRLHSSDNVNIYLHVTSRAIMEDCHNIFLAPYNLIYTGITQDFKNSGLDIDLNNWKSVDDFNWLNVEKTSPNWAVLDEEKIVANWDLTL